MPSIEYTCTYDGTLCAKNTMCTLVPLENPSIIQEWTHQCPVCKRVYYQATEIVGLEIVQDNPVTLPFILPFEKNN